MRLINLQFAGVTQISNPPPQYPTGSHIWDQETCPLHSKAPAKDELQDELVWNVEEEGPSPSL